MANGTPSILSEAARRWLGSVENVAPQMLPARAEMAAKTGLMSFQDALMIKKLADQIRGGQQESEIPRSNVMQDKIAQISGRAPVKAPPPQMPQPQAPMPEDPRMQGGLGTLPAPTMDNAQFAGGGIVAFAGDEGSYTGSSESPGFWATMLDFYKPKRSKEQGPAVSNAPPTEEELAASEELRRKHRENVARERQLLAASRVREVEGMDSLYPNINVAFPQRTLQPIDVDTELAKEDYGDYDRIMAQLKADKEERGKNTEYDRRMALAAAGFRMAQAASQPGATFMGSLAEGGAEGIRGLAEARKRVQDADAKTREMMMNLEMSKGADRRAARRGLLNASQRRDEAISDYQVKEAEFRLGMAGVNARTQAALAAAAARGSRGANPQQIAQAYSSLMKVKLQLLEDLATNDPAYRNALNEFNENKDDMTPNEYKNAYENIQRMQRAVTADIDQQLAILKKMRTGDWSMMGDVTDSQGMDEEK